MPGQAQPGRGLCRSTNSLHKVLTKVVEGHVRNEGVDLSNSVGTWVTPFPIGGESPVVDGHLSSDVCHCSSPLS